MCITHCVTAILEQICAMPNKTCSKSIRSSLKQFKTWHSPRGKRVKNITIKRFGLMFNADNPNERRTNLYGRDINYFNKYFNRFVRTILNKI